MPEHSRWPQTACGEKLRSPIAARRLRAQRLLAAACVLAATPCAITAAWRPPTLLVWNVSASVPPGLYRIHPVRGRIPRGQIVMASLPPAVRRLAADRGYLPARVPLIKPVAAIAGERVCASGAEIRIDGRLAAIRKSVDGAGRRLPHWNGCVELGGGEYFLLSKRPWSFDGRYFGISPASQVAGLAERVWEG